MPYKKNDNFYGGSTKKNTTKTTKRSTPKNSAATATKPWAPKPERTPRTPTYRKTGASNTNRKKSDFIQKTKATRAGWYDEVMIPTLPRNMTRTENGAIAYATTGKALLDLNYQISTMRQWDESKITSAWRKAYSENPRLAIRWLGYLMSVRDGQGERRSSRIILKDIANNGGAHIIVNLLDYLVELTRWDIIYDLLNNTDTYDAVANLIRKQWKQDVWAMNHNKPCSLMAKWISSANSKSTDTRKEGLLTCKILGLNETQYRKTLSMLRKYIDVVERKMCSNNWQAIDYEKVPSKANLIYNKAFLRHDEERRRAYLGALDKGEAKINSSVAYPHDIVHKYDSGSVYWGRNCVKDYDSALEAMWRSLPDMVKDGSSTIVCRDDSGSMTIGVDPKHSNVSALEVATALSIYFAERCKGPYHNKFFSFSETPKIMELDGKKSLHDKLEYCYSHSEVANTNIERLFDLILETAVKNHCSQEELPDNLLIISDMAFDSCVVDNNYRSRYDRTIPDTLFDTINKKYKRAGYKMPKLIFWNCSSRSGDMAIPVKEHNKFPAILVSGFSVNTLKMVMSNKTNPWDALVDTLMDPKWEKMEQLAFGDVIY